MKNFTLALISAVASVQAAIVTDGPWTNHDWTQASTGYKFTNGIPSSDDAFIKRLIKAPIPCSEDEVENYSTKENVQRVAQIMDEAKYNEFFPLANDFYTYQNFLKAVGKFPYFCNEVNLNHNGHKTNANNVDEACKRELATLFAHISQESAKNDPYETTPRWKQGLYYKRDEDCAGGADGCDMHETSEKYPPVAGKKYYGRGPLHLVGNFEYGAFSEAFGPVAYDSKNRFLQDPDLLETDGFISWASAIWLFMTPIDLKPSMHDVMTNHWIPNGSDTSAGLLPGFGGTIEIINGDDECGTGESDVTVNRWNNFSQLLLMFNLHGGDVAGFSCATYWSGFPHAGSHYTIPQYFVKNWDTTNSCKAVNYQTPYNIYVEGDYKRCVCDLWGDGASSCPMQDQTDGGDGGNNDGGDQDNNDGDQDNGDGDQDNNDGGDQDNGDGDGDQDNNDGDGDGGDNDGGQDNNDGGDQDNNDGGDQDNNDGGDQDNNDGGDGNNDGGSNDGTLDLNNEVSQAFEQIWADMHYNEGEGDLSRTLYQVDMSLDYIEDVLIQMDAVLKAKGLITN